MAASHRPSTTPLLALALTCACSEAPPATPQLEVSAAEVVAGASVRVSWAAPDATSVDLTDSEGRALRVSAPPSGAVDVAILQSTELRAIARYESEDTEARRRVEAKPRLVADVRALRYAPGETRFELRWDSLGAETLELAVDDALEPAFAAAPRGAFEGVAKGAPGVARLRLRAASGGLIETFSSTVARYGEEQEPNDRVSEAGAVDGGVLGQTGPDEVDVFSLTVPDGGHVQAALHDTSGGCATRGALRLVSEAGEVLAQAVALNGCATLTPEGSPGDRDLAAGAYFVEVRGVEIADYLLVAHAVAPRCGNELVESRAGEHCEPAAHPAQCRADCTADVIAEVEPNDRNRDAQPIELGRLVAGRVDTPRGQDVDVYSFEIDAPARLQISATGPRLSGCEFAIGGLTLRREDGIQLTTAPIDQRGQWCGRITGLEQDALPAGRYLVVVDLLDLEGPSVPRYFLRVDEVTAPVCGDGRRDPGEACDDGNRTAGDGCDPACELEPAARWAPRIEPHRFVGGPLEAGQATLVELEVDEPCRLIVDAFVPSEGRCDGPDEDVRLWLDGERLSDDGGIGRCAAADTFIEHEGPPQVHRLVIEPATGRLGAFTLEARLTPPEAGCGDLTAQYDVGEACDDGNLVSGDGCSDSCALEPAAAPPITAATTLSVPPLDRRGQTAAVPVTVGELDTRVTFTPQPGPDGFCAEAFHMVLLDEGFGYVGGQHLNFDGQCRPGAARAKIPGAHYFVVRNDFRRPVRDLRIDLDFEPPTCGDGVFTASRGEGCDDGGVAVGDGCDDQCQVEAGLTVESEPNDTAMQANLLPSRTSSTSPQPITVAAHQRAGDPVDFFVIDNASGGAMSLDVFAEEDGECGEDYTLRLTDELGALVAEDGAAGGLLRCRHLTPSEMPALAALPPGRYTLEVDRRGARLSTYYLKLQLGPEGP